MRLVILLASLLFVFAIAQRLVPVLVRPHTDSQLQALNTFRDCPNCPDLVLVVPGSFVMGSPKTEKYRGPNEDQVKIKIDYFYYISSHPITVDQFSEFVRDTGYETRSDCWVYDFGPWEPRAHWRSPTFQQTGTHPVTCISWTDAKAYTSWLSSKIGKSYRLPSEAEFEYAARAGTSAPFWFGRTMNTSQGRYAPASNPIFLWPFISWEKGTVPVTSYPPNPWGLYDVHGDVWEITEDCWSETNAGNPGDGRARTSGDCSRRAVRGGSWHSAWFNSRSASRHNVKADDRYYDRGFRIVRE
jgi:formylglycine-generating enzyme required for sulfatase activity